MIHKLELAYLWLEDVNFVQLNSIQTIKQEAQLPVLALLPLEQLPALVAKLARTDEPSLLQWCRALVRSKYK